MTWVRSRIFERQGKASLSIEDTSLHHRLIMMNNKETDHFKEVSSQNSNGKPCVSFVIFNLQAFHLSFCDGLDTSLILSVLPLSSFPKSNRVPGY